MKITSTIKGVTYTNVRYEADTHKTYADISAPNGCYWKALSGRVDARSMREILDLIVERDMTADGIAVEFVN